MKQRIALELTLELLSDTIFGSGYSIPGGEDVAVAVTEGGFPYLKGSTLKGLLRESLENLLVWTGGRESDLNEMMGVSGWNGEAEYRRIRVSELRIIDPPKDAADCFSERTFTSLEAGVVKQGTLRTASCIRRGLCFSGILECAKEDLSLVTDALSGISQAGTMRNRGFGSIRITAKERRAKQTTEPVSGAACIRYRLRAELPVAAVDAAASSEFASATKGYIPGAAIRGAVLNRLAESDPAWFDQNRVALLRGVRFSDVVPVVAEGAVLPSPMGFYEDKGAESEISSIFTGDISGKKRAKLGSFCVLDGNTIRFGKAKTGGVTRIDRPEAGGTTQMFQVRYLEAGQDFTGCILLDDPALSETVTTAMGTELWLGADRYAGFGKCSVTELKAAELPDWVESYGFGEAPEETTLYMLAVSPVSMLGENGDPCGLNEAELAKLLGVSSVRVEMSSTSASEYHAYNRNWQMRSASVRMYDRGSMFRLKCDTVPTLDNIRRVELRGIGIRTQEGFGQVLFLLRSQVEGITRKEKPKAAGKPEVSREAAFRDAKYRWVMNNAVEFQRMCHAQGLSDSQVGSLQSQCEKAIAMGGDRKPVDEYLTKNLTDRGAKQGARFTKVAELVNDVLSDPLIRTLGEAPEHDGNVQRLELLCMLFDHARKLPKEDAKTR